MILAAVAVLLVPAWRFGIPAARSFVFALRGKPFRMTLTPASGRCLMQFSQPDRGLVSPMFIVDLPVGSPRAIELRSDAIPIPGCKVEFYDTTLLPGRFQLRVGKTLYDVMGARIEVDGKIYRWASEAAEAN
jgi:hypothetical protein